MLFNIDYNLNTKYNILMFKTLSVFDKTPIMLLKSI